MGSADPDQLIADLFARLHGLGMPPNVIEAVITLVRHHRTTRAEAAPADAMSVGRMARFYHRSSVRRTEVFGSRLVADTAWNMLLDLIASREEERPVCVTSLCIASGGPTTTALRQIAHMEEKGLVQRQPDRRDHRRTFVEATDLATERMETLIRSFRLPPGG